MFLTIFSQSNFAQQAKTEQQKLFDSDLEIWQKYIEIASLPLEKKARAFSDISNAMKSAVFRFHLASQIFKRKSLTNEQKEFILEVASKISAEDYDSSNNQTKIENIEARAKLVFSNQEVFEIFTTIKTDTSDSLILEEFQQIISQQTIIESKKYFRNLSSEQRSLIWQNKFALYLVTRNFNKSQQEFILEGMSLLNSGKIYSSVFNFESEKFLSEFEKKALTTFPKEQVFTLFMTLNGESGCSLNDKIDQTSNLAPGGGLDCTCRYTEWCLIAIGPLVGCRAGCEETTTGCGLLLGLPCVGTCQSTI